MLSNKDVQRLLQRASNGVQVLSAFLDTSVNSENKRTFHVFLNRRRAQLAGAGAELERRQREAIGDALERLERWLADEYDESNKGVAFFTEVGGHWSEALQFPVVIQNRIVVAEHPVIGPLVEVLQRHRRHGVALVDRENLRLLGVCMATPVHEQRMRGEPLPAPRDLQRGGYSQQVVAQRRKAEEVKHYFKEFAAELAEYDRRHRPDDFLLLGTEENVKAFLDFLSTPLRQKVVQTAPLPESGLDAPTADVVAAVRPYIDGFSQRLEAEALETLRERLLKGHLAVSGFEPVLELLQNVRVEAVAIGRDLERSGARCLRCKFVLVGNDQSCPYCGGETRGAVDLVESVIRIAREQEVPTVFTAPSAMEEFGGIGALLRY